jgi:hypothetical protein
MILGATDIIPFKHVKHIEWEPEPQNGHGKRRDFWSEKLSHVFKIGLNHGLNAEYDRTD